MSEQVQTGAEQALPQNKPLEFKVGDYYTGVCDEVRVVRRGDFQVLEFGFEIPERLQLEKFGFVSTIEFKDYTGVFLGSDKVGKDGKTNDDRIKEDLILFGCERAKLDDGNIMAHIRGVMHGKEIEMKAGEYKKAVQFEGCQVPGMRRGPSVVVTENPFGFKPAKPPPAAGGAGVF